ncbi:phage baseplate assembly protein [Enterobacter roggenkampii]|uniref:phage baseplate assembly protein n=2 Tax=Enterobacter roggenkampii TaxID=1812935 RepID=UPI001E44AF6D|nr:hypothetical protein [Enterobacter roggenkampii]MCE1946305.1 hypothetical protein [Enterobacter roggenkampii]
MAKQSNTGLADDLNAEGSAKDGLSVDDLNAGTNTQDKQPLSKTDDAESSVDGDDEKSDDTESQEYVVLKGNCIRHDGEMYRENMRIPVPQFTLNWGESPQEVIDRVARWSALLYYDQPDGNLLLTRVGTRRAASGIAEGVNVEQAYYRKSMADRFSDYVGVSMSVSPIAGYSPDTAYDAVTLATARDPEAARMRYRKHISIVESTLMATQQAQSAIDWEMNRRYGRSKQLSVTIDSWRDKDGKLWEPNTLIPVDLPTLRLPKTELLLAEVTYMRDDYGTHARMTLMPPEAFSVQPYAFYQNLAGFNT